MEKRFQNSELYSGTDMSWENDSGRASRSVSASDVGLVNAVMAPPILTDGKSFSSLQTGSEESSRLGQDTVVKHAVQHNPISRAYVMYPATSLGFFDEWFIMSLVSIIFCFPLGIIAVIKFKQRYQEMRYGEFAKAELSFAAVKLCVSVALLCGIMIPPVVGVARYHINLAAAADE